MHSSSRKGCTNGSATPSESSLEQQVTGGLSSCPDSPNLVNYNAGLQAESIILYYHTSDERQRMFPVDPNIGHTNVISTCATTRR
jgi:hypothetical protein